MKSQPNVPNRFAPFGLGLLFCILFSGCFPQNTKLTEENNYVTVIPMVETAIINNENIQDNAIDELINNLDAGGVDIEKAAISGLVEIGSPAVESLILVLQQDNSSKKIGAAEALGQIMDPRAVEPLINTLQDDFSLVRKAAAEALGMIKDQRAVDPLIVALQDEETWVKEAAAEALGEIKDPRAVDPLIEVLSSDDSLVIQKAIIALGKIMDGRAVEPLMRALTDADDYYADLIRQSLVMIGAPSVDPLITALNDQNSQIQLLAVSALGEIEDPRAVEPLIAYLKIADEKIPVMDALIMIGEPSVELLIATLENDDVEVKGYAVQALGRIKDPRAVEPLIVALLDEDFYYNFWAAIALGDINDPRAIDPLIASMKGYNRAIQEEAKNSLVKIGARSVEPLINALKNEDPGIRRYAVIALGKINDSRAIEPLIATLNDEDFYVRLQAPQTLAEFDDPRVVDPIISALHDKWSDVRMAAADALGVIKDKRSAEPLITALEDEDPYVRRQVALALGDILDDQAIQPLIAVLSDENSEVQMAAAQALSGFKDSLAINTLIDGFQNEDLEIIAGAYSFFIERGNNGSETLLITALNKYGSRKMAKDYMNCGNQLLDEAANEWASEKGFIIILSTTDEDFPRWGSNRQ